MNQKENLFSKIDESLRGYDLMLIETGGRFDGKDLLKQCIALSKEYINIGCNKKDLVSLVNAIIRQYVDCRDWKYYNDMMNLLSTYKNIIEKLKPSDISFRFKLTEVQYQIIENSLEKQGYFDQSNYSTSRLIETTSTKCPICDKFVIINICGKSYSVECEDEICFYYSVRGI